MTRSFTDWFNTFITEKNVDLSEPLTAKCGGMVQTGAVATGILRTTRKEQAAIKHTLVAIDFKNGDVMHFFRHLAMARTTGQWDALVMETIGF